MLQLPHSRSPACAPSSSRKCSASCATRAAAWWCSCRRSSSCWCSPLPRRWKCATSISPSTHQDAGALVARAGTAPGQRPLHHPRPACRQPAAAPRADRPWRGDRRARHPGGFLALHRRRRKWPRAGTGRWPAQQLRARSPWPTCPPSPPMSAPRSCPTPQAPTPVVVRHWFNPNLVYRWFIVPGLTGILALFSSLLITSLSIARERELGTFDQSLVVAHLDARDHHLQVAAGTRNWHRAGPVHDQRGRLPVRHPVYGLVCTPACQPGAVHPLGGRHRPDDFRGQHDPAAGHPGSLRHWRAGGADVRLCDAGWRTCRSSCNGWLRPSHSPISSPSSKALCLKAMPPGDVLASLWPLAVIALAIAGDSPP